MDNGGTVTKAVIYTSKGEEIASAKVDTEMITPHPGFIERDMNLMWQANCNAISQVICIANIDSKDIAGVAVCGHGKGLYLWGKDDQPVRNGIISTDNRAWEYVRKWKSDGTEKKAFDISYQHVLASQPVSLLAWLKDNEPDTLSNTKWIFECKDYIRFLLTGEARAEISDYSGTNLMNLQNGEYDRGLLRLFGIDEFADALPPLCNSTELCGHITKKVAAMTGLIEGTPVAGGMFDIDACALAVDIADENHVCMIAGTWSINEYISSTPVIDGSVLMNSLYCIPGYYLIEESSSTSAANNEWFINALLPEIKQSSIVDSQSIYDVTNGWVESISPDEFCPIFLPFLFSSNVHPNAMSCFVGMSSYHSRAHLMRSVYEGIAFSHRYHMEKLLETRKKPVISIRLAGGVAHSKVWTQMFADIMRLPIEKSQVGEAGALGCAMAAAVAVGEYRDLNDAMKHMCNINTAVLPNASNSLTYDNKYNMYKKVIEALNGIWDDMQKMKHETGI